VLCRKERRTVNGRWFPIAALFAWASVVSPALADPILDATNRGRDYLMSVLPDIHNRGEKALGLLACSKAGLKLDDPVFESLVDSLARDVDVAQYIPQAGPGPDNYETAVVLMALASADQQRFQTQIHALGRFLASRQISNGVWDYGGRDTGDTSQSQYAILGLWEAANTGLEIDPQLWDKALDWHITRQDTGGGFAYHPAAPPNDQPMSNGPVQHSTTVGGLASMFICRLQLGLGSGPSPKGDRRDPLDENATYLIPVVKTVDPPAKLAQRRVDKNDADEAIKRGTNWLNANFTIEQPIGPPFYYLYGLERFGALANQKSFGSVNWYERGAEALVKSQNADGSWRGTYQPNVDTSFAVLFLAQSTRKTLQRIQIVRLDEGTLSGGRGIPTGGGPSPDYLLRQKARYQAALRTTVDDILESLTLPDESDIDSGAAAAIESAKPEEIVEKLSKNRPGLRKLAKHPSPAVREAGLWAMARLRDYRFAPILIEHLRDPDPEVYRSARDALRFLSRRIETNPLPDDPPDAKTLDAAVADWQQWFNNLQVEVDADQEFDDGL
jgi:hypothetical protein